MSNVTILENEAKSGTMMLVCNGDRATYTAFVQGNDVRVLEWSHEGQLLSSRYQQARYCPGGSLQAFLDKAGPNARLGWSHAVAWGGEAWDILHFYDASEPDFADEDSQAGLTWAMNLQWPDGSELGHSPFPHAGQSVEEFVKQSQDEFNAFIEALGGEGNFQFIDASHYDAMTNPLEERRATT